MGLSTQSSKIRRRIQMNQIKENTEIENVGEDSICWRAIPIQYDNYFKEKGDSYNGDIFGDIFDSPHYLYRRFHRNYCKAYAISNLLKYDIKYYEEHPEEMYYYTYPEIVQEKIKEGIKQLKIASVYARRIDFLLSSDDGDESFIFRLSEDLNKISN